MFFIENNQKHNHLSLDICQCCAFEDMIMYILKTGFIGNYNNHNKEYILKIIQDIDKKMFTVKHGFLNTNDMFSVYIEDDNINNLDKFFSRIKTI